MKNVLLLIFAAALSAQAQQAPPSIDGQVVSLWPGAAPGALGSDESDIPTLTVYLPRTMSAATPAAIICPGGSYRALAANHEGRQVANYLNSLGVAAFVLRYRLGPRYHHPDRTRRRATRDSNITLSRDRVAARPGADRHHGLFSRRPPRHVGEHDLRCRRSSCGRSHRSRWQPAGLCRPRVSGDLDDGTVDASRAPGPICLATILMPALARQLSGELAVTKRRLRRSSFRPMKTPWSRPRTACTTFSRCEQAGVPAEMHVFEKGAHGVGLANDNPALSPWSALLATWMRGRGLIK